MSDQAKQVWANLQGAGLVQGRQPEKPGLDSPWYVKTLLAISGWLAALFILGFLGVGFELVFRSSFAACMLGALMIGGAYVMLRMPGNEFVEHLGLAVSLAGQVLVAYAIFQFFTRQESLAWLLLVALQGALAVIMPNFVHRVFSSCASAVAFAMALIEMDMPYVASGIVLFIAALCWLNEFRSREHMKTIRAIGYGLVLALIALKGTTVFGYRTLGVRLFHKQQELWTKPWMGELIIAMVTLYVVWRLLQRYGHMITERLTLIILLGTLLVCAVSIKVQGITVGLVILLLGFSGSNRVLLGLGIVSLLFYVSSYYYLLETTLFNKSQSLLAVGLALLGVRWIMQRLIPLKEEARHG